VEFSLYQAGRTYAAEQGVGTAVGQLEDREVPATERRQCQQVAVLAAVVVDVRQIVDGRRTELRRLLRLLTAVVEVEHRYVLGERDVLVARACRQSANS